MAAQLERAVRVAELRSQEVLMNRSTGIYSCSNCDWKYDETKGDAGTIGGMVPAGMAFADLPSDWRCPMCRGNKEGLRSRWRRFRALR